MQTVMLSCGPNYLFLETPFHSLQPSMLRKKRGFATWLEKHFSRLTQHVLIETMFGKIFCSFLYSACEPEVQQSRPCPQTKTHKHKFICTHTCIHARHTVYTLAHKHYPNSPIVINHRFSWGLHGWRFRHSTQHSTSWYS